MYWALTTMTKVPWLPPLSTPELGFAAFVFTCGILFYAFLVGETSAIAMAGTARKMVRAAPLGVAPLHARDKRHAPRAQIWRYTYSF